MNPFTELGRGSKSVYVSMPSSWMDDWLILTTFYHGLTSIARDHLDAAAKGAFFSLTAAKTTELIEKMVFNQGWNKDHSPPCQ